MADISEAELKTEIEKILQDADLSKTSTKKVRQQLEKTLGKDLSQHREIIDKLVMNFVESKPSDEEEAEASEEEEEEAASSEEEVKKPAKRPAPAKTTKIWKKASSEEEPSNDSESEEEKKPSPKKKGRKKNTDSDSDWGKKGKGGGKAKKGGGKKGSGYTRAYRLSEPLGALMGRSEMARHEVVRAVWALIKERDLYDHSNKQFAICDDALYKVFGTKRFRIFGMMKYLKTHFLDD